MIDVQKHYYLIMSFFFLGGVPLIIVISVTFQWIRGKLDERNRRLIENHIKLTNEKVFRRRK